MFKLPKKLLIIDVETSSANTDIASMIQLGAVIMNENGTLTNDIFNVYIKLYTQDWSKEAQEIHKLTKEFLEEKGLQLHIAIKKFEDWASKLGLYDLKKEYYIAQWSCGFDSSVLNNAYATLKAKYPFHYRSFDIASIVRYEMAKQGKLYKKCGCNKCAEQLGIEKIDESKLHNGLYDAILAGKCLEKLAKGE